MSNPVRDLYIRVSDGVNGLHISSDSLSGFAGTQWDDNAQRLVFERDEALEELEMLLIFYTPDGRFEHLLGTKNTYAVRNSLTKHPSFTLQIAFIEGGDYRYGANKLELRYRSGPQYGSVPAPEEGRLSALEAAAFCKVSKSGSVVTFFSKSGKSVGSVSVGSGGGSGYTPVKGVDYWTTADIAGIEADMKAYIDAQLGGIINGSY